MLEEKINLLRAKIKIHEKNLLILKRFNIVIFELYKQHRFDEIYSLFNLLEKEIEKIK